MQKNITHLTLAGTYAGHTYCGAPRGDTKCAHMPYVIDQLQWAKDHILCEECIQVLADSLLINKQKNDKH